MRPAVRSTGGQVWLPIRTWFGKPCAVDRRRFDQILAAQAGVVSRRQVLEPGFSDTFIRRQLRRREWTSVHTGIYVNHTGPLGWWSRAWAAVLFYWPAALSHESALIAHELRFTNRPAENIHVAVDQKRRVRHVPGIELHRITDLSGVVQASREPARVRLEHSLLDTASAVRRSSDAIALLSDACQRRRTTPARLASVLRGRRNIRRRKFLLTVLDDVAEGLTQCSSTDTSLEWNGRTGCPRGSGSVA